MTITTDDPVADFVSANTVSRTDQDNGDYIVFASNATTTATSSIANGGYATILTKQWRAEVTEGTPDTTSDAGLINVKFDTAIVTGSSDWDVVQSDTADFSSSATLVKVADLDTNGEATGVQIADGKYYAVMEPDLSVGNFITTWRTTSASESITIPVSSVDSGPYSYTVDWGDGSTDTTVYTSDTVGASHTYVSPGDYTVTISGAFPRILFGTSLDSGKIISVDQWGDQVWTSMESAFENTANLEILAVDTPDLSAVTTMKAMFKNAGISSSSVMNTWGTGSVTDMSELFSGATSFNQDISNWDVTQVINMTSMFSQASTFNQPLHTWDTGRVEDMTSMFSDATAFDQNIGSWDVASTTDALDMFQNVTLSTSNYDALLIGWNAQTLQNGVSFSGGDSLYCFGASARGNMVASDSWSISDGGPDGTIDCTPPTPPTVSATSSTETTIDLSWIAGTDDVAVDFYEVYRDGSLLATTSATTFSDTGLIANTTYSYVIVTVDTSDNKSASSTTAVVTTANSNSVPTDIQIAGANNVNLPENNTAGVVVGALTTTDPDGGDTHTYSLCGGADDGQFSISAGNLLASPSFEFELPADTNTDNVYEVCIRTTDSGVGNLTYDETITITVTDVNAPPTDIAINGGNTVSIDENITGSTTVGTLTGVDDGEDNNTLTFSLVSGAGDDDNGAFTITGSTLAINSSPDFETQSSYSLRVQVTDGVHTYEEILTVTVTDLDEEAPIDPTNVATTSVTTNSIDISWTASTDNIAIDFYNVYRDGVLIGTTSATTFADSGLNPLTSYTYGVQAVDTSGNTSGIVTVTDSTLAGPDTAAPAQPTVPIDLQTGADTGTSSADNITSDTTPLFDALCTEHPTSFVSLYVDSVFIASTTCATATVSIEASGGLLTDGTYIVNYTETDASGNESVASPNLSVTIDTTDPNAPTGLATSSVAMTTVGLTWVTATDPGGSGPDFYSVYRDGVLVGTTNATSLTDTGLAFGSTYVYTITTTDIAGNTSPFSSSLSVTTVPDTTAPSISNPLDDYVGTTAGAGSVDTDESGGTLYWVATTVNTPVTAVQILAGQNASAVAAVAAGSQSVTAPGVQTVSVAGLAPNTQYYIQYLHQDASGNQSVVVVADGFVTRTNSSGGGGGSTQYVCRDPEASNFAPRGREDNSVCIYTQTQEAEVIAEDRAATLDNSIGLTLPGVCPYFSQHMQPGDQDGLVGGAKQAAGVSTQITEIALLQKALSDQGHYTGAITGLYDPQTESAVSAWQMLHQDQVLAPWGLSEPTGEFYQSSERWMNELYGCNDSVVLDNGVVLPIGKYASTSDSTSSVIESLQKIIENLRERLRNMLDSELELENTPDTPTVDSEVGGNALISNQAANCPVFTQYMKYQDIDNGRALIAQPAGVYPIINQVSLLQTTLKNQGFFSSDITGFYGLQTVQAVSDWQQLYRNQVLTPWGLTSPTGHFYQSSERWMNKLLGCSDVVVLDNGVSLE